MKPRGSVVIIALLLAVAAQPSREARSENYVLRKLKAAGRAIGGLVGAPIGGLAEAAATPTIRSLEGTGQRLLIEVEGVAARRLDQVGGLVDGIVDNTFDNTGKLVAQVDTSLAARILQVTTSVNTTVENTADELKGVISAADRMIAANIARVRKTALAIIERADQAAADRLAQIDEIIRLRLGDVGQIVQTSLAQVDEIAKARIAQLDEAAGRRLGNLDVIATKQSLALEATLLRLGTLLGVFAFLAFMMWAFWRNFVTNSETYEKLRAEGKSWILGRKLAVWGGQVVFAFAVGAVVVVVAGYLPKDAERRRSAQIAEHADALHHALRAYDFAAVRYHHSQLEILQPGNPTVRGIALKADLLRDLLGRPARLHTAEGLREIDLELEAAGALLPGDPDLLVLEAFVIWQVGGSRRDELDAADLCAQALTTRPRTIAAYLQPTSFMLRPLAENYIRQFRHDPYAPEPDETAALARVSAARIAPESHLEELEQVFEYNRLVSTLDLALGPAYLTMLDAHVAYDQAAAARPYNRANVQQAFDARTDAAGAVVAIWEDFDHELAGSEWLSGDPTSLNAFTLDDSVLSQALYFWDVGFARPQVRAQVAAKAPAAVTLPPLFFDPPPPKAKPAVAKQDPAIVRRVAAAPMRIRWAERWSTLLGKVSQDLLAKEEAERFRVFEKRARDFATSYVAVKKAALTGVTTTLAADAERAARHAAAMGLYQMEGSLRHAVAPAILDAAAKAGATVDLEVQAAVTELGRVRRVRFL